MEPNLYPTEKNRFLQALVVVGLLVLSAIGLGSGMASWAEVTVTEGMLIDKVQSYVQENLPDTAQNSEVSIDVIRIPNAPVVLPHISRMDDLRFKLTSDLLDTFNNRAIVRVIIADDQGNTLQEVAVPVQIRVYKKVYVSQGQIPAGQSLSPNDFRVERREVSRLLYNVADSSFPLKEYAARVMIRPGSILDTRQLTRPPAVERNEEVRVVMTNGQGMKISFYGTALESGRVGQNIRVRHSVNKEKTYTAKIVNAHTVLVEI